MAPYETPIVHDELLHCGHCNVVCKHHVVDYPDASYRTCTRCQTKTTLIPIERTLKLTHEETPDVRKDDDFKRDADRKLGRKKKKK